MDALISHPRMRKVIPTALCVNPVWARAITTAGYQQQYKESNIMAFKTDIEIAQETTMQPITEVLSNELVRTAMPNDSQS